VSIEVRVRGRVHHIEVRADRRDWIVTLDDRRCRVNLAPAGASWSLLIADEGQDARASRRSYDVAFERERDGDLVVHVNRAVVPVSLPWRQGGSSGRTRRSSGRSGTGHVVAPMPGRVVSVLVEPGDEVAERQAVVVLEAMKMQNEVRAPRAGVVTDVRVQQGSAVDAGAVLVVISDRRPAGGA